MKVTSTSQLGKLRMFFTMENGTPAQPNGSMKANVGGSGLPFPV
jgi:hypothetical protein